MKIAGYIKTSLIEWPGKISSVIFVPGCNFRCPFCHNSDLVDPQKINKTLLLKEKEILTDLKKRKGWIEAVVITGGEPTLQKDLPEFLNKIKELGFLTMIHTNGTKLEIINKLLIKGLMDYIAMDLKGDIQNYEKFCNVKCQILNVKSSAELIVKSGVECEFRTTVVPGLHNENNLVSLAEELKEIIGNCRWYLQQFRPLNLLDKEFLKIKPYSKEEMLCFQNKLKKIVPNVILRGI